MKIRMKLVKRLLKEGVILVYLPGVGCGLDEWAGRPIADIQHVEAGSE